MAQQVIDALAAMARTMSAGTQGSQSDDADSGTSQNWASLRLEQTIASYFDL